MMKREFARRLVNELEEKYDVQTVLKKIKDNYHSVNEQLEIVNLIREIYIEETKGVFEDVNAFLALVNQVEEQIKSQSNAQLGDGR